jgi:hypothetical protein
MTSIGSDDSCEVELVAFAPLIEPKNVASLFSAADQSVWKDKSRRSLADYVAWKPATTYYCSDDVLDDVRIMWERSKKEDTNKHGTS